MKPFLFICCLLVAFAAVHSETEEVEDCYKCYSTDSWEDCYDKEEREECRDECVGMLCDKCYKFHDKQNSVFKKGCTSKYNCDNGGLELCQSGDCEVWCCDGDNCNGAPGSIAFMGVIIMMGAITLANYLF